LLHADLAQGSALEKWGALTTIAQMAAPLRLLFRGEVSRCMQDQDYEVRLAAAAVQINAG
jgi:hypothetical protein